MPTDCMETRIDLVETGVILLITTKATEHKILETNI